MLTIEKLLDTIKKAIAIPRPEIEELVLTEEEWLTLKKELNIHENTSLTWNDRLFGIRLWVFPTKMEVIEKAIELACTKNRVAILEDKFYVEACKSKFDDSGFKPDSVSTRSQLFGGF